VVTDKNGIAVYIEIAAEKVKGVVDTVYAEDSKLFIIEGSWNHGKKHEKERNKNRNKIKGFLKKEIKTGTITEQEMEMDPTEYTVTDTASITLNGSDAELGDLQPGHIVILTLNDDSDITVIKAYSMPVRAYLEDEDEEEIEEDEVEDQAAADWIHPGKKNGKKPGPHDFINNLEDDEEND